MNIYFTNDDFDDSSIWSSMTKSWIILTKLNVLYVNTDFSPSSPGMMFMEQAAYVGDVLSFYLDNQLQENFLQYAQQTRNVFDLAYMFGYKPRLSISSQTTISLSGG